MTRIYHNRGFERRMNISVVVVGIAVLFGFWELWSAYRGGGDGLNTMFAIFFFGGAIYGWKMISDGGSDTVVSLDADLDTRESVLTTWRPFSSRQIAGPLDRFTDWQLQRRSGRVRTPMLTAHHPGYPRPLEFELGPSIDIGEAFRALAPEALAAFEKQSAAR